MFGVPPPEGPPAEAFRVYRTYNYRRIFSHVIILVEASGHTVSYRHPGSKKVLTMSGEEWDRLDMEPCEHMKDPRREI